MESVHDRFIGYGIDERNCQYQQYGMAECYHLKLDDLYQKNSGLHAFQLGMFRIQGRIEWGKFPDSVPLTCDFSNYF